MTHQIQIKAESPTGPFTALIDGVQMQDKNGWLRRFKSEKNCLRAAKKAAKQLDKDLKIVDEKYQAQTMDVDEGTAQ